MSQRKARAASFSDTTTRLAAHKRGRSKRIIDPKHKPRNRIVIFIILIHQSLSAVA